MFKCYWCEGTIEPGQDICEDCVEALENTDDLLSVSGDTSEQDKA